MATAAGIEIDPDANSVHLTDVTIFDEQLVDYLTDFETEEREEALSRALTVGAATLELAETEKELEYVRREFNTLHQKMSDEVEEVQTEMEEKLGDDGVLADVLEEHLGDEGTLREHIDAAFGEDGVFIERLDEELGEDGERIQAALDPDQDGTPTNRLLTQLRREIQDLRDAVVEEDATEEVRSKTTLKGDDFEENVERLLDDLCHGTPHSYEYKGEEEGLLNGREIGDFIVELGDTDQRLVIEAKSEQGFTKPKIRNQMEDSLVNRDADYGLFVSECQSYVPNELGYLQEFEDFVTVCLSRDDDDEIDRRLFEIGFNWAKIRAGHAAIDTGEEVDAEYIHTKTEEIEAAVDRFSSIKGQCTSIRKSANRINERLEEIKGDILDEIHDVRGEVAKVEG